MSVHTATLRGGGTIEYVVVDNPPAGGMKKTYFTPDRSHVVQFFLDQSTANDPQRLNRLEAILGRYNPTTDAKTGPYFKGLYCWPTAIVEKPELGIVAPCYPSNFFFGSGPFQGREKEGKWFSSPRVRRLLPDAEKGTWLSYFQFGILIARAVRRLHQAGLAHSDLSSKNILVDPTQGRAIVIDIDSLVVPQIFPPDVLGTPGYIAPEVLATQHLPLADPHRFQPNALTDQHALAVLLYEYLLQRHPLRGPKVNSTASAEEDERLSMGEKALWIENPQDQSNRPPDLGVPYTALGSSLASLFERAFIKGLHSPNDRPAAIEWERAMVRTWDLLLPCPNPACSHKWFVLPQPPGLVTCPFCQTQAHGDLPLLRLRSERRAGHWLVDWQAVAYHNKSFFRWHTHDNVFPDENADRTPQGYTVFHQGQWLLINQNMPSLTSPGGNRVPSGQAVALQHGRQFRLAQEPHGRMADVEILRF